MAVKQTRKRKQEILLPDTETIIYQPNRVTNGKFDKFSLYQMRVLVCIMNELQDYIKKEMSGTPIHLFAESDTQITLKIAFNDIAQKQKYNEIKLAVESLRSLTVSFKSLREGYVKYVGLINSYEIPESLNGRKKFFYVSIDKDVANRLIKIDKNNSGVPVNYTKYLYEIAITAKSVYTTKLYWLISSWKKKGGFYITLPELREKLGIEDEQFKNYAWFKRDILIKAQNDLTNKADCWFNCAEAGFEVLEGRKVVGLNFKVITPDIVREQEETEQLQKDNIIRLVKRHFDFTESQVRQVLAIIQSTNSPIGAVLDKIAYLGNYISENPVKDKAAFVLKSLQNEFDS